MNRTSLFGISALSFALAACEAPSEAPTEEPTIEAVQPEAVGGAKLSKADGSDAGTAELTALGDEVTVKITLANLTEGVHAVHLHTTGSCEASDFTSAGGHLNPAMKEHGLQNPAGAHLGDLPNAVVDAQGNSSITATLHGTRAEAIASIFDDDGTAVVVHEDEDDNVSDPAGNAGSRVACGVVTRA
jgi:Cu-Zn family superoxide dismutase